MPKNEKPDDKEPVKELSAYAKYTGMAFQMIVIIGIFAYAGYKIDENAHHSTKWVTALLSLIGVFISLFIVIRSVRN
ncbi:AtpZ/AtpI family protein [Mucilaginibacter sp. 14171R-50]|uniref:AtpZ/AtpI family protein n=1 Tax=Mucilaginibacter sp. 14171R-50 TaxID=2703789 RepID=UPI00138B7430|nr:AtpZ/AtpI family protein [Mucilaginibacter sp. 14171R-50]QHS55755.1 AtpZ/AtpI family protein [Mucilaginibacter sp. 14171R-50]